MKSTQAVKAAYAALTTFTDVKPGEDVLIITDESGLEENGEIVYAMFGIANQIGASPTIVVMEDAEPGASQGYLPDAAKEGMKSTDVLIGITLTTIASCTHHHLPDRLREEGRLRALVMAKRSYDALTSSFAIGADYDRITEIHHNIRSVCRDGSEAHWTSSNGMDVTMSIENHLGAQGQGFAREPGGFSTFTWGEYAQAPDVGTTEGTFVIDGPVLEFGWPSPSLEMNVENGRVTDIRGDRKMSRKLMDLIKNEQNADNIAEIAFGTNPIQSEIRDPNVQKKVLGTAHTAIGAGISYGQDVKSPVHIDMVTMAPTIDIDGTRVLEEGEYVLES